MYQTENKNEIPTVPVTELLEVKKQTEKRKNRGMAVIALAASLFGFGAAKGVEAAPAIVEHVTAAAQEGADTVADALNSPDADDLTGTVRETVPAGGTLEQVAVEADPSVDPRIIESAIKDRTGITPENVQPGEIIDVPVTPQAAAEHAQDAQK